MRPEDLMPSLPHEGPPLPKGLKVKWPMSVSEAEEAVRKYQRSADKAVRNYRLSFQASIETYRLSLLRRIPL